MLNSHIVLFHIILTVTGIAVGDGEVYDVAINRDVQAMGMDCI